MAIPGIEQPAVIQIDELLRLRKFDNIFDFALEWYQDEDMVYLVDGEKNTYDMEHLTRMYHYLDHAGKLYFWEQIGFNTSIGA